MGRWLVLLSLPLLAAAPALANPIAPGMMGDLSSRTAEEIMLLVAGAFCVFVPGHLVELAVYERRYAPSRHQRDLFRRGVGWMNAVTFVLLNLGLWLALFDGGSRYRHWGPGAAVQAILVGEALVVVVEALVVGAWARHVGLRTPRPASFAWSTSLMANSASFLVGLGIAVALWVFLGLLRSLR